MAEFDGVSIIITLTSVEVTQAAMIGIMRHVQDLKQGLHARHGLLPGNAWQIHIEGACGEMAVAKHYGKYWNGNIGNLKAHDVGHLEVRTTRHENGRLILHKTDPDDAVFVLLTGECPSYTLRGWIRGADGKKTEFWDEPRAGRAAYFVPASKLTQTQISGPEFAPKPMPWDKPTP